jgi:hypothetical protein
MLLFTELAGASPSTRRSAAAQARCWRAGWKSATLLHADWLKRSGLKGAGSKIGAAPVARLAIRWPAPGPIPKPCPEESEVRGEDEVGDRASACR